MSECESKPLADCVIGISRNEKADVGLYEKFYVKRTDRQDEPGCKHENCKYFVLDITHDPFAIVALHAYARACEKEYPVLSAELLQL